MKHEALAKVTYMAGILGVEDMDWEELVLQAETIVIDWQNRVDIQDEEEEGYIMKYAERKWKEQ